tara:strand:+ start:91477 stop:92274 length:798 start_codon:yes stop_codon:yes gene_type:complete
MSSFLKRSLSGLVYVILFASAILFSNESYIILTSIFGLVCIWEFSKLINYKSPTPYLLFFSSSILVGLESLTTTVVLIMLIIALSGALHVIYHLFSKNTKYPKNAYQKEDLSVRYIVLSFVFLLLIPFLNGVYEPYVMLYLLLLIWSNDSFAYLIGKNFGKRKLFESVSPKKTIEGFIGGVVFTIITGIVISHYSELFSITHWVILSLIASVLGTIGDLIESKFKRQANIKDSGTIMPGHGGLLDRLDSLLFVAPFVYLYIHYII